MKKKFESVKVKGYRNTWSSIDCYNGYYLLENDTYGDETCYLVVDGNLNVLEETYDDLLTALEQDLLLI